MQYLNAWQPGQTGQRSGRLTHYALSRRVVEKDADRVMVT
jgi:hypothetical protein